MTDKTEILEINTYKFVIDTIEVLARGCGMTTGEFAEYLLEEALEALYQKSQVTESFFLSKGGTTPNG